MHREPLRCCNRRKWDGRGVNSGRKIAKISSGRLSVDFRAFQKNTKWRFFDARERRVANLIEMMDMDLNSTHSSGNPPPSDPEMVTRLLAEATAGGRQAARELLPLVYRSLRALAAHQLSGQRRGHTLQATALVHEAYLRLVGSREIGWDSRAHFYAAAAESMRCILIDHARRVGAQKRGGGRARAIASVADLAREETIAEALEIDEAIEALRREDPRAATIVHLRFYTGLSIDESAAALNIAPSSVDREWRYARAWLLRYLQKGDETENHGATL